MRFRHKNERGQVLVIGLFVIIGLTLVCITVANVGIVVGEKIRAQDTVDASAYSAAVTEARYMNLAAYVNRAMVANYNSMAFNTAMWAVMDADDHGIAVVTALLYEISAILFIIPITTGFAPTVDSAADGMSAIHDLLHAANHYLDDWFAQDNKDMNQYIELFNKDILTMLEGILYAATQSARHQVISGVAKEMNPKVLTTSVLGLGAESVSYDELARAVDWVIRDTDARGNPAKMLNKSFDKMHGSKDDDDNPLYLAAVTEASLDNFTAGRTREGTEDLLRNFSTGNIASGVTDAAETVLDIACYSVCWPECIIDPGGCCDCNAQVSISLGAMMRDGYENKHDETHVPFIARQRMREVNFFGLRFRIEQVPGISEIADLIGDNGHTSGEKHNDIGNEANASFAVEEGFDFSVDRMLECFMTSGCKLNNMNIMQAKIMLPIPLDTMPLFDDDHWDGTFDGVKPVCTWQVIPPAVCLAEGIEYMGKITADGTERGVPKYDWQVDLDNIGFGNYIYPTDGAQSRPSGTSAGSTDNIISGPSIAVAGIEKNKDIPGVKGLGIGNDYSITVFSRAQVYYLRNPKRPDEKPSLFNPYWVPRLAPIDAEDTPVFLRKVLPFSGSMGAASANNSLMKNPCKYLCVGWKGKLIPPYNSDAGVNERLKSPVQLEKAQAMVEFVIILTIFMTMISGVLYFFRLNLYQYWADQESRYIGFEQTWVPRTYYESTGNNPIDDLQGDAVKFSRPKVVGGLGVTRNQSSFGGMSELIPGVFSKNETRIEDVPIGGLVETAYASGTRGINDESVPRRKESSSVYPSVLPQLDRVLEERLHRGGFGGKFCSAIYSSAEKHGVQTRTNSLFSNNCSATVENQLSRYISKHADIPDIVRELDDLVADGQDVPNAVQQITRNVVAEGFYSFFYNEVNSKFGDAQGEITSHRASTALAAADSKVLKMMTDLRYIGSTAAIAAILAEGVSIGARPAGNRDSISEKSFEDGVNDILHIDASDILPVIGNGYLLNPTYLPVPPIFGPLAPGLFSGTMRTALSLDAGDVDEMINQSVKKVTITYDSANGLFAAATRRFRTGVKLQSSFVIDTDPWHIQRRENGTGSYRDIGGEFDTVNDSSEEGQLRRRVNGMWLFPTPPDAFFDPILAFTGLDALKSLVDAFKPFGTFLSQIKSFITNNPLTELANTLADIPFIGSIVPRFPVWPVVRPDAYPGSVEMKDDKKMGAEREFKDYIDEQRQFNPSPDPEFN